MKHHVLVVDDQPEFTERFEAYLESRPELEVDTFTDPNRALAFLRHHRVQAVFLDIMMLHMSGTELCRRIRRFDPICIAVAMGGGMSGMTFPASWPGVGWGRGVPHVRHPPT